MDRQLQAIVWDLDAAGSRLRGLQASLPCDVWTRRPAADRWSPAECVAHLNLTSKALLPLIGAGLREAASSRRTGARYRRDPVGWLLWKAMSPSAVLKTRTAAAFEPSGVGAADAVLMDFERLQADVVAAVQAADGLPIDQVKVVSPFDRRVSYNLYAALTLVPRHQHRHLQQAERSAAVFAPRTSPVTA